MNEAKKKLITYVGVASILSVLGIFTVEAKNFCIKKKLDNTVTSFQEGKTLVCNKTLRVVDNENWSVFENHLINKNIAGYIDLRDCEVEK